MFENGAVLAHTVPRVNGDLSGLKRPEAPLRRTKPRTCLHQSIFESARWRPLDKGAWKMLDHINLGECRVALRVVRRLAASERWHRHLIILLEDNRVCAAVFGKGTSPSPALNHICRQMCAAVVSAALRLLLPWVESAKQPADAISREC